MFPQNIKAVDTHFKKGETHYPQALQISSDNDEMPPQVTVTVGLFDVPTVQSDLYNGASMH